ncbi:CLUMA_CG014632, isoform A [Clunio marinus]|uniref:CLUMA_CG014632, isoform A n=1 Tax=Clunio marinus TaxID=568069 RepID=A0A1J1IRS9_9DIPT|nr:CLUMA_CG014632, isoform A [Clunio marinus]
MTKQLHTDHNHNMRYFLDVTAQLGEMIFRLQTKIRGSVKIGRKIFSKAVEFLCDVLLCGNSMNMHNVI